VLFDFAAFGGLGALNFALAWILFVAYVAMGAGLVFADGGSFALGRKIIPAWRRRLAMFVVMISGPMALRHSIPVEDAPLVRKGFVVKYGREMPLVLHDGSWSVKAVAGCLEDGYRIALAPGVAVPEEPPESVWLFGTVAESAHRFPDARITVVDPPEFCPLPPNAERR